MVRFGSRRLRRYRRYRRFYRRYRGRYGYSRKYVNGSTRSAIRMKTVLDATAAVNLTVANPNNQPVKYVCLGTANTGGLSLVASPLFRQYAGLYDEMKVIGMKVTLAVATPVGTAALPSIQIHTAWDRHAHYGEAAPTAGEMAQKATHTTSTALNNNVAKITRSIYASDLMEKAMMFQSSVAGANPYTITAWEQAEANFMPFSPAFIWYCNVPDLGAPVTVNFNISIVYYVAFRSPRYGGSGGRAAVVNLGRLPYSRGGDGDEDMDAPGDMDQGGDGDVFDDFQAAGAAASADADGDLDVAAPQPVSRRQLSAASTAAHAAAAPVSKTRRKNA